MNKAGKQESRKPRSINISLLDGNPDGIRIAQISMSTIQAIAFRRNQLRYVREMCPEIERPGAYILIGNDENEPERQIAYIGESEGVGARLAYHNSNTAGRDEKEFWTDTVVLISKDENLTKSHARYVEACLIRSMGRNPRWSIPNIKTPSADAGKLPLPDRATMNEFVDQTKTLAGALGWDLFCEICEPAAEEVVAHDVLQQPRSAGSPRFFYRGTGFRAEMVIDPAGDFRVQAGSQARIQTAPSIPHGTTALRNMLLEKGVLTEEKDFLVFTCEYSFSSVSAAAAAIIGTSANGRILWHLADGKTYADWEEAGPDTAADPPPE